MHADDFELWLKGLSAHSTRVGLTKDLFTAGADIGGMMDNLRRKTPRMALAYNRNLMAESGAAAILLKRMGYRTGLIRQARCTSCSRCVV
jgi:hypothetical protein